MAEELQVDEAVLPLSAFDYELPERLIAQQPCPERDQARLMVLERDTGTIRHRCVSDLPELLSPGDLLVLNNTRVLPARLVGRRQKTGGKWQGLFLNEVKGGQWRMLCQSGGRLREDEWIEAGEGLRLRLTQQLADGEWLVTPEETGSVEELLRRHGHVPLPPYIRKGRDQPGDAQRYQTVFAEKPGAVAAPTAGLHFTPDLLQRLKDRGVDQAFITLHVGLGTFRPIQVEDLNKHRMHAERGELPAATVEAIEACRSRSGRVVAVGTTTVRVLESVAASGPLRPWNGETDLFIRPPFEFKAVDALLTNFHLPRSSLLVLVSAFAGLDLILQAYRAAIEAEYRFYSYGDAMLIC